MAWKRAGAMRERVSSIKAYRQPFGRLQNKRMGQWRRESRSRVKMLKWEKTSNPSCFPPPANDVAASLWASVRDSGHGHQSRGSV